MLNKRKRTEKYIGPELYRKKFNYLRLFGVEILREAMYKISRFLVYVSASYKGL